MRPADPEADPISIAIEVADPELAARVYALLGTVAGIQLVGPQRRADLRLVSPPVQDASTSEPVLTPRELEVLTLLAEGASNKTIAQRLRISIHTAKFHVGQLIDKLDASGRTDAVAHAARLRVLEL